MMKSNPKAVLALAALLLCPAAHGALMSGFQVSPVTFGEITPTDIIMPVNENQPGLYVVGDTQENGSPSRIAIEFPLAGAAGMDPGSILGVTFSATSFGGALSTMVGNFGTSIQLDYALFGYAGSGELTLNSGTGGGMLAGPFTYRIVNVDQADLTNIDVTDFVKSLIAEGRTHAGFVFRDINTKPNTATDKQLIVVQDSPAWGGDVPPSLTFTLVPEPGFAMPLAALAMLHSLRRRRRAGCRP